MGTAHAIHTYNQNINSYNYIATTRERLRRMPRGYGGPVKLVASTTFLESLEQPAVESLDMNDRSELSIPFAVICGHVDTNNNSLCDMLQ